MKMSPVSFGSLFCFKVPWEKDTESVENMLWGAFNNNPKLKGYDLQTAEKDIFQYNTPETPLDGSVNNAKADFCDYLDEYHKKNLPADSRKVYLSNAYFTDVNNKNIVRDCCFITAATSKDEEKILEAVNSSNLLMAVRLSNKRK